MEALASLPPGHTGKIDLWATDAPAAIELIWVNRGKTPGGIPYFKTQTSGYVLPLVADRIAAKVQKRYECDVPLELLAYIDWGELAYANARDEITALVQQHLSSSQFRRVWVYEGLLRRVALRYER